MEILNSIILGFIQGITEFLPISSSGHLILVREVLGEQVDYGLAFDAVLQLATTLAILVYFHKDIFGYIKTFFKLIQRKYVEQKEKTLMFSVIIATIPAVILGLLLEDFMDTVFRSPVLVAGSLIFGAVLMYMVEKKYKETTKITKKNALGIGFFQSLALIPGFSRSGMTITGGLFFGLNREEATRFAFILAFPILLGSGIKKFLDLGSEGILDTVGFSLFIGSIVSFAVGLGAIHFLVGYLKKHSLNVFVVYRIILAIVVLVVFV